MINNIFVGDCLELFKDVDNESVDLVFADPPFNLGKKYNSNINDSLPLNEYKEWTYRWLDESIRVLKPTGSLVVHHIPLHAIWIGAYLHTKLTFNNWIAWKERSWGSKQKLYPAHYAFLLYSKGNPKFNPYGDLSPHEKCRHCGQDIRDWGGKEKFKDPRGNRCTDVWDDIHRIRHKGKKIRQANELPLKILERFILLFTDVGDLVIDPFMGSGTTAAAAIKHHRNYIGFELSEKDVELANRKLNSINITLGI